MDQNCGRLSATQCGVIKTFLQLAPPAFWRISYSSQKCTPVDSGVLSSGITRHLGLFPWIKIVADSPPHSVVFSKICIKFYHLHFGESIYLPHQQLNEARGYERTPRAGGGAIHIEDPSTTKPASVQPSTNHFQLQWLVGPVT